MDGWVSGWGSRIFRNGMGVMEGWVTLFEHHLKGSVGDFKSDCPTTISSSGIGIAGCAMVGGGIGKVSHGVMVGRGGCPFASDAGIELCWARECEKVGGLLDISAEGGQNTR